MHLGQTESGAAAHFPQATSEGNPPPGPLSPAKPWLQAQGRASQWLGCGGHAMKTSRDLQTLTPAASKQAGEKRLYTVKTNVPDKALPTTPWARHILAASSSPRSGTCPFWPPCLLFSLSSKKLRSHSVIQGAETTFSQELKCQDDSRKPGWSLSQQEGGCYSSNLLW